MRQSSGTPSPAAGRQFLLEAKLALHHADQAVARARIEARYTLDEMLKRYEALYEGLARRGTG